MLDKELLRLLDKKGYVAWTVVLSVASLFLNLGITACVCIALAWAYEGVKATKYAYLAVAAAALVAIRFVTGMISGNLRNGISNGVKTDLRNKTYRKIVDLGVNSADDMNVAGLTQISLEGIEQLDLYYSSYLPQFFYAMIAPVLLFCIFVFIDWRTAVILLACVPLIPLSIVAVSKYAKKVFAKYWGRYVSMGDGFLDGIQGMRELKIFKADKEYGEKMNVKAEEFRKITMKVLVMQLASTTIMDLVAFGGAGAGIAVAVWGVAAGRFNAFVAMFIVLTAAEFFLPLRSLGSAFHVAMNGASAGKKISALLKKPLPEWGKEKYEKQDITIEGVDFSYTPERKIIDGANMVFSRGMTAIVGESGSGKSTIAGLVTGALRADKGEVKAGEKKLSSLDRSKYYSQLALISSNTYIFNASVEDNFRLAKPDVTQEEIWQALKKVNLDGFIKQNGGLEKIINEDGGNISGGEKQRLALAVNLVCDKYVYIFDEATSNIDADSEKIISDNVVTLARDKIVIMISHRLANVVKADKIYYIEKGRVAEQGTHDILMSMDGKYAQLYKTQQRLERGYSEEVV